MAKALIVFDSKTGHTENMAFAVAARAKVDQASIEDLLDVDGIIMGSPTHYGHMSSKLKALIDESVKIHGRLERKVGAAFTSSGGTATGAETTLLSMLQAILVHGMIIQGWADSKHYDAAAVGLPHKRELEHCNQLGRRTAALVKRLKSECVEDHTKRSSSSELQGFPCKGLVDDENY